MKAPLACFFLLLCAAGQLKAAPPRRGAEPGNAGRFWHITDLHLDPTYHLAPDPTKVCFSSKGEPTSRAGPFGDFLCDSPYSLIQSAFEHMSTLVQPDDFIIWTGDSPPHVPVDELSTSMVIQVMSNMTQSILKYFPNITVFPAVGNHDYWPQDQMPTSTNDIYKAAARLWKPWLEDDALKTLSQGGFYTQLVGAGLRVISVNSILYYGPDKATANMSDPAGQFEWLEDTLKKADANIEKVMVISHVPVGYLAFLPHVTAIREEHNERLITIYRRYSHVIAGHFYGHTHKDSVMVLLNEGEPVNSLFVSPAVTPIKDVSELYSNNPAVRLYFYDKKDYGILDIWQYFLNLTEANLKQRADWTLEYVMTDAFNLPDLRPLSLIQLGLNMWMSSKVFNTYFAHYTVSYDDRPPCEDVCKKLQLCSLFFLDKTSYSKCLANGFDLASEHL
ncbi:acid sphingomyelinase-like phosphodiesterase 3a [Corythoichthys intestinalis]|uniref:acid sphingomyelinase-like phosphodiesterase 3a n=1 Tax=Corythoichthys intestinalis TaxID=161448 RepID=UPI0025A65E8B|nr:acid sphingomyelinase-like phosphodiesterase 3a [Corythoichthys intestinalis]XP_061806413.1 acid sphingomyelinase-like phosphodiesterase 3a [Nerophis lumbriciformis]